MTRRASALGATLYAAPMHASRVVGFISPGQEVVGAVVEGEVVIADRRWIRVEGYVPIVRTIEDAELAALTPRRPRRGKRVE